MTTPEDNITDEERAALDERIELVRRDEGFLLRLATLHDRERELYEQLARTATHTFTTDKLKP